MIIISHRGNLTGPNIEKENNPDYILNTLNKGYDVEIDVWFYKNNFYLGHDSPIYKIDNNFLINKKLWCHAKNIKAIEKMMDYDIHYFWHETDKMTITNLNIPWCFPDVFVKNGITVVLNKNKNIFNKKCYGICTDYVNYYSNLLKNF